MTHHLNLIRHVWIGRHMQLTAVCACGWESTPQRDRRRAQAVLDAIADDTAGYPRWMEGTPE